VAAYAAAIGLTTVAAYFSIRGMAVVSPGRRWRSTAWIWRVALAGFVLGLAVINAGGTYSQLVAAHVGERGAMQSYITTKDAELAGRIEVAAHAVADLDTRVSH
jgi:hypothetical protein